MNDEKEFIQCENCLDSSEDVKERLCPIELVMNDRDVKCFLCCGCHEDRLRHMYDYNG